MFKQSSLNNYCTFKDFKVVKGDIRVQDTLTEHLKTAEIIILWQAFSWCTIM